MSQFPRIDPDHPLTEAARYVNAHAEEHGLPATLEWLGTGVGVGEFAYLAEQRAMRAYLAATRGVNLGAGGVDVENMIVAGLASDPRWREIRLMLIGAYMDAMAIGWKAHELASAEGGATHADET